MIKSESLSDSILSSTLLGMIFGIPILIGISILAIPFIIISCITDVPMGILIQNLLIFAVAVFVVRLFSKYQIIENGIVGLLAGKLIYTHFKWHSLACIIVGVMTVGLLFFISYIKIGFWIKTVVFSTIITFLVFVFIYSDVGLFPAPDVIWKAAFCIIFFLENIFIRCTTTYHRIIRPAETKEKLYRTRNYNRDFARQNAENDSYNQSYDKSHQEEEKKSNEKQTKEEENIIYFAGIHNVESLKKRYHELLKIYHPDNQNGDITASQKIQEEYEYLSALFMKGGSK